MCGNDDVIKEAVVFHPRFCPQKFHAWEFSRMIDTADELRAIATRAPRAGGRALVKLYRVTLSPLVGFHCRYLPTCSDYADQALERHGLWAGGWMTLARLHALPSVGELRTRFRAGRAAPRRALVPAVALRPLARNEFRTDCESLGVELQVPLADHGGEQPHVVFDLLRHRPGVPSPGLKPMALNAFTDCVGGERVVQRVAQLVDDPQAACPSAPSGRSSPARRSPSSRASPAAEHSAG